MLPDEKIGCHHAGMQMTCFEGVIKHKCQQWVQLQGLHPQTGEQINEWGCADKFKCMLEIKTQQLVNELIGSVQSLRNETVRIYDQAAIERVTQLLPASAMTPKVLEIKEEKDG